MIKHLMLDLETWGTEPGCDIRSIGACVFDPLIGTVADAVYYGDAGDILLSGASGSFYVAVDNPLIMDPTGNDGYIHKYPLHRDPRTVQWWSEQSDEAQAAFANPVDLREGLTMFADWLTRQAYPAIHIYDSPIFTPPTNIKLWSHGSHFDSPILAAAYRAVGLPVPWHYRAPRDTRTCFDLVGIDDHSEWLKQHPGPLGIPHHALDDSICQARAVCGAYDYILTACEDAHTSWSPL